MQPNDEADMVAAEELPLDEVSSVEALDDAPGVEAVDDYDTVDTRDVQPVGGAPPVIRNRTELPDIGAITLEDREFIKRVFNQVKDVDFRSAPPPPPRKNLAGLDKKMQFLRDRVRELERDLARVGWIWSIKQRQVDAVDQLLDAKENERAAAVARYATLRDQAAASAERFRAEETRLNNVINEGVANASRLEGELAALRQEMDATIEDLRSAIEREQNEKNSLIADFRNKIETAQAAFNQLRDTSARTIADGEARVAALTAELTQAQTELTNARQQHDTELATARQQYDELTAQLQTSDAKVTEVSDQLAIAYRDLESARAAIADGEHNLATANDESAKARGEFEAKLAAAGDELASVRTELEGRIATAEAQLADATRGLEELRATVAERDKTIVELNDEVTVARNERETRAAELQANVRDAELKAEDAGRTVEGLKAEVDDRTKANEQQRLEIEGLKTDVLTLTRQLEGAEEELRKAREAQSEVESRLADRDGELMALREEQRIIRNDNDRMSKRLHDIDRGVSSTSTDDRSESGSSEIK